MCTNYWLGGIICCRSAPKEEKWKRAKTAKNWIAISALLWDFSLLFLTIKKAWDYWIRNVDILLLKLSTVRSQNSSWCSRCPSFFNKGQKWWALRVKECFISLLGQQFSTLRLLFSSREFQSLQLRSWRQSVAHKSRKPCSSTEKRRGETQNAALRPLYTRLL